MKTATVNQVCAAYVDRSVKVTMKPLPGRPKTLLIEGDELGFDFLGKLFLAHAKGINGCGFSVGPREAGNAFFSKKSSVGIYLHRLPCDDPKGKRPK